MLLKSKFKIEARINHRDREHFFMTKQSANIEDEVELAYRTEEVYLSGDENLVHNHHLNDQAYKHFNKIFPSEVDEVLSIFHITEFEPIN